MNWDFEYKVKVNGEEYDVSTDNLSNDYEEAYELLHPEEKEEEK